jgi:RNA polymerase sigma-70 factor (ECF subfamily)
MLVQRYQSALFRVARSRIGRDDWAEDVVQETLLCVFKSLSTYDSRYSFRTWLWTILLNQCRRHLKKQARSLVQPWDHRDAESCLEEHPSREDSPLRRLALQERSRLLDTMLAKLPEAQADALRLRFFGQLKFHEIARTMECSLSTAKNRVRWGLEKLAIFLNESKMQQGTTVEDF